MRAAVTSSPRAMNLVDVRERPEPVAEALTYAMGHPAEVMKAVVRIAG